MLPKVVFFDLDDTIISFDSCTDAAWITVCESFTGTRNCTFDSDTLINCINQVRKWYWGDAERHRVGRLDMIKARREIVGMALEKLNCFNEESAVEIADGYSNLQDELICLFPNSIDTLKKLKLTGTRMALITNGSAAAQRRKIVRFCLSDYFEYCFIEEEVGYGKPDIRVFQTALQKMKVKPEDTWMVGDNLVWDIEAPQKLGIYSIWNDYKRKGLPKDSSIIPDKIINDISELVV